MTPVDAGSGAASLPATPRLLKPLLFSIAPSEIRCSDRADALAAVVVIASLHMIAVWSLVPAILPAAALVSPRAVAVLLSLQMAVLVVALAVRWSLLTYVVWAVSLALGAGGRSVVPAVGVVVMADLVTAVQIGLVSVVARLSEVGVRSYLESPRMGLDLLITAESPWARAALASVDVFGIWYSIIFYVGLRTACGLSTRGALLLVSGLAVLSIALRVIVPVVAG